MPAETEKEEKFQTQCYEIWQWVKAHPEYLKCFEEQEKLRQHPSFKFEYLKSIPITPLDVFKKKCESIWGLYPLPEPSEKSLPHLLRYFLEIRYGIKQAISIQKWDSSNRSLHVRINLDRSIADIKKQVTQEVRFFKKKKGNKRPRLNVLFDYKSFVLRNLKKTVSQITSDLFKDSSQNQESKENRVKRSLRKQKRR